MMNDESDGKKGECRSPAIHHSSLILHHSPRRGLSLLEVLVSMGILTLGVLGVAMLIPIGKFAMTEVEKSDRTGACGRAGLRDVQVRRMLDTSNWATANPNGNIAVIDPLGCSSSTAFGTTTVGGSRSNGVSTIGRNNLSINGASLTSTQAENIFRWQDDLNFVSAKGSPKPSNGDRPMLGSGGYIGDFSWFLTVAASPNEIQAGIPWYQATPLLQRRQFNISVVVCWKRDFSVDSSNQPAGEQTCDLSNVSGGIGGATVSVANDTNVDHPINKVREDQWVMLVAFDATTNAPLQAYWYRVVGVGRDLTATNNMLTLVGPDWDTTNLSANGVNVRLIVINGVTGVYTRTVQLDNDATWSQ
jgi:hypothetical protein